MSAEPEPVAMTNQQVAWLLAKGFPWDELDWKVQQAGQTDRGIWARIVPYIDSRAIVQRLDDAFGPGGHDITLTPILTGQDREGNRRSGFKASITVRWPEGQTTTREDVAEETDTEPMKGGASGAIKRAAVLYGIGRYLYTSPDFWAEVSDQGEHRGVYTDKRTKEKVFFKWSVPREAIQWVQETIGQPSVTEGARPAATAPSQSNANSSPAPASPPPSRPARTAAPTTHSDQSPKMPGRDTWFKDTAGLPIADVATEILHEAAAYYRKKIAEKPNDRWVEKSKADLALLMSEIEKRGEGGDSGGDDDPGPEEPGDWFDDEVPF